MLYLKHFFPFFLTFGILFFIIGFPIWLRGCNTNLGFCVGYTPYEATVVSNECYITHGSSEYLDDTIGENCNVYVKYVKKGIPEICKIHRSDSDYCGYLITRWSQMKSCNKLNMRDYKLNTTVNIFVDSIDNSCDSSHYVSRLQTIGFAFLIISAFFIIMTVLSMTCKIRQEHLYFQIQTVENGL